jgi:hypothetical protein
MEPISTQLCHLYSLKDKLSVILEWETGPLGCKAVARKYVPRAAESAERLGDWEKKREYVISKAAEIKDVTSKHHFLLKISAHEGRKPETDMAELECVKGMHGDIWN